MANFTRERGTGWSLSVLLRGLCALILGALLFGQVTNVTAADPPLSKAVEEIQGLLREVSGINDARSRAVLVERLGKKLDNLTNISDLVNASLLLEWFDSTLDNDWAVTREKIYDQLVDRVVISLKEPLRQPNPGLQVGLLGLLRSGSEQVQATGASREKSATVNRILTRLLDSVLETAADPSDEVQIAAVLTLGAVNSKPDETATAFSRIMKEGTVEPRRSVTDAVLAITTQVKKKALLQSTPKEQVQNLKPFLDVLALGLRDPDMIVRRRSGNVLIKVTRHLADQLRPNINEELRLEAKRLPNPVRGEWLQLIPSISPELNRLITVVNQASQDTDPVVRALATSTLEQIATLHANIQSPEAAGTPGNNELDPREKKEAERENGNRVGNDATPRFPVVSLMRPMLIPSPPRVAPVAFLDAPKPILVPVARVSQAPAPNAAPPEKTADLLRSSINSSLPALQQSLKDPNIRVRLFALDSLELIGAQAEPLIPDILTALQDPDKFVRWSATRVLRGLAPRQSAQVVPALARLLGESDTGLRKSAIRALAAYRKEAVSILPQIIEQMTRADVDVRAEAIGVVVALEDLGEPAIPALIDNLSSTDTKVRQFAAEALGLMGPRAISANSALKQLTLDEFPEVRRIASQALFRINSPATPVPPERKEK